MPHCKKLMLMKNHIVLFLLSLCGFISARSATLFLETESFTDKGGWVVDQQFMDEMGSPYLLAHGMGKPVKDAVTTINLPETNTYYIFVRTYNWTSPWHDGPGAGRFQLLVNGAKPSKVLGDTGNSWFWQRAGVLKLKKGPAPLRLHDLTGFEGRCDAIYFTTSEQDEPPTDVLALKQFRRHALDLPEVPPSEGKYDFVVCGAGTAGISAAVAAARLGCRVALVNDRPVVGGNNSSEIRVHVGGLIQQEPYIHLGDLQKEFNPSRGGNAQPAATYEDDKKMNFIRNEKNITLLTNYHVTGVLKNAASISAVIARHIESGREILLEAPLFCDCTGDGSVGFLAGADYRMGREARDEFHESDAPEKSDSMTLGASVMWYAGDTPKSCQFPEFNYGLHFTEENCEKVTMGEWTWETGMLTDKTKHFELVRDYGMLVIYSNWSFLKNHLKNNRPFANKQLDWVAFLAGKRESRRLLGDYILKENDLTHYVLQEDGTAATTWPMDLHEPDPQNSKFFPHQEFKSINKNIYIYPYPIPYRCFYSRNVDNLFMAGRDISVTHLVLGTIRVMRTTGMMGEVVGMAASLCRRYGILPRDIYLHHFDALKELMNRGVSRPGFPDNQHYNENTILKEKPQLK